MLLRRRHVWLPTLWGWLLLIVIAVAACTALAVSSYALLAPEAPARNARTLVVEGWLDPPELKQAVEAFRRGHYERVLTTGGPIEPWVDVGGWGNYAARAAAYLRTNGLAAEVPVIAVPAPETKLDRTWLSAQMVREWAQRSNVALDSIDLYSSGVHARRSWMVYRMAFGSGAEVGVLAAEPVDFDAKHWWTSSAGAKATMSEIVSLAWTQCCFWPTAPK
jgi:hypothetical protein